MLVIDNDLVKRLLPVEESIQLQDGAFKKIPAGGAIHRPRIDMYIPCERQDGYYRWGTMECGGWPTICSKCERGKCTVRPPIR